MMATIKRMIAEKKAEQARLLTLYTRGKLDEDRWVAEDVQYQREIASYEAERTSLAACLASVDYSPEYLAKVKTVCQHVALGLDHFTLVENAGRMNCSICVCSSP